MSFEVPCIKELAEGLYEITQEIRSQVVYGIRLDLENLGARWNLPTSKERPQQYRGSGLQDNWNRKRKPNKKKV